MLGNVFADVWSGTGRRRYRAPPRTTYGVPSLGRCNSGARHRPRPCRAATFAGSGVSDADPVRGGGNEVNTARRAEWEPQGETSTPLLQVQILPAPLSTKENQDDDTARDSKKEVQQM